MSHGLACRPAASPAPTGPDSAWARSRSTPTRCASWPASWRPLADQPALEGPRRRRTGSSGTSPSGPFRSASSAAGSTTSSPRPMTTSPATTARRPGADPADLARRAGHLGRRGARRARRLDRLPQGRHQAAGLRGRRWPPACCWPRPSAAGATGSTRSSSARPTTLPWGLQIDAANPNFPAERRRRHLFHPTFLYESLWNLAGVALLLLLDRRFWFRRGACSGCTSRTTRSAAVWIEALRIDDAEMITIFGVTQRLNVWTSLLLLVVAVVIFIVLARQPRTPDTDSVYLPGRAPTDDVDSVEPAAETAEARQDASTDDDGVPGPRGDALGCGRRRPCLPRRRCHRLPERGRGIPGSGGAGRGCIHR